MMIIMELYGYGDWDGEPCCDEHRDAWDFPITAERVAADFEVEVEVARRGSGRVRRFSGATSFGPGGGRVDAV
ncbi:hypothetical protein Acsp01_33440 [Actinoplanes sp. NBRC 101535]|nr:hypothetical protein Acsp01_33440 [Actinoplanes sp. NBRC 101535]